MQREGSPSGGADLGRGDSALPVTVSSHPQDYISLFPLDDMQPSKLMRLLSSNEEEVNILSSPGECGRAGQRLLSWALGPQRRHLAAVREGVRGLSRCVSCGCCGSSSARSRPRGTRLSLPRPLLPTSYQVSPLPGAQSVPLTHQL